MNIYDNSELFEYDLRSPLLWQYNNATKITSLIEQKNAWHEKNIKNIIQDWQRDIYNLDTANDFGIAVWAIRLGVSFSQKDEIQTIVFGFDFAGTQNFDNGGFRTGGNILTIEQKRIILKLRFRQLFSNGSIEDMISAIKEIAPNIHVLENNNMSISLINADYPTSQILQLLEKYSTIIPRPAGVKLNMVFNYGNWFGFSGSGGKNFNNGGYGA